MGLSGAENMAVRRFRRVGTCDGTVLADRHLQVQQRGPGGVVELHHRPYPELAGVPAARAVAVKKRSYIA